MPVWSPGGQFIVYTDWSGDLWKVSVSHDGVPSGEPFQVTNDPAWEGQATWSNNSKSIIFHSNLGGSDFDIWSIPADGGIPEKVTGLEGIGDYDPCASSDGRFVAYAGLGQ